MSGKKRKKPLHNKQHKFFTESQPNVHTIQSGNTKTESVQEHSTNVNPHRSRLMGMKLISSCGHGTKAVIQNHKSINE